MTEYKEHISNLIIQKRDIRIVYRENKLHPDENNWLGSQMGLRTSICKNLHAKCYLNENEAIITSMNLYEFSQQNNNEMGIHVSKALDPELYHATLEEVQRLLTISEELKITVQKIETYPDRPGKKKEEVHHTAKVHTNNTGYCIRTGVEIPFNAEKPLSYETFKKWNEFGNPDFPERFCHFSGEPSHGETCVGRPILKKNWKKAKEVFNL